MNIYLATRYSRAQEMQEVAKRLKELGHAVTSRWIWNIVPESARVVASAEDHERTAIEDMEDLVKSDLVLSFTGGGRKGGRHVEFGMAVAFNKWTVIIGPQENAFHHLPSVDVYATLEDFLPDLQA